MYGKLLVITFLGSIGLMACSFSLIETPTQTSVPSATLIPASATPPVPSATVSPPPTSTLPGPVIPSATSPAGTGGIIPGSPSGPYGVVLVAPNDVLNIRSGPGAGNPIIGSFQSTFKSVMRTGPSSKVGEALWVEVQNPAGGNGWVNAQYLAEYTAPAAFCADPKVSALLDKLDLAITSANGEQYSALISPAHGLDLRLWRYGTVANYDQAEARFVFSSSYEINWGPAPGSGQNTIGTFSEAPLPNLLDVLNAQYERHCNDALDLATFSLVPWPPEYANINFYTLYKPGSPGVELDWRAWLAGIETVQGQPYLFALIHFQWEP